MRKAMNRRAVLKTGTALAAATVVGVEQAQAIEANPDTELQALYSAYQKADANACYAAKKADILDMTEEESLPLERAVDEAWNVWHGVVENIAATPAKGPTGLKIKLLVWDEINMQPVKDESCCARSALKDLKRITGNTVEEVTPIVDVSQSAASNSNDMLLAKSYARWLVVFNANPDSDEEGDRLYKEMCNLEETLVNTKADTLFGIEAKESWLLYKDNYAAPDMNFSSFKMFKSLMADVKRFGGHHV